MFEISKPKSESVLSKQAVENISKLKASRSGFIGNLTKCINCVLILIDNIQNYDEVSLLCNKIKFAIFNIKNITERYCALISEEEIVKARQLVTEQELPAQEALNFCKSLLENIDNASLAESQSSPLDQFFETPKFNVTKLKETLPEGSLRSKYSSKSSKALSSSSNTWLKSNESLFKLRQDTEKAKIFADQIEEQANRKLQLIKIRQELGEAETLNAVAEAKERLKVAQMLETLMEDTVSKYSSSVKSESVSAPNHHLRAILKSNCPEFKPYLEHKTKISELQTTNSISQPLDLALHILFPKVQMIKSK